MKPKHDKTNKMCTQQRLSLGIHPVDSEDWFDWADVQADLSLRWMHSHFVGFLMLQLNKAKKKKYVCLTGFLTLPRILLLP